MAQGFIENNLQIISKQTMDLLLKQNNPSDVIGLYLFYYYTAKWQETNQPKATPNFCMKALKWGELRFYKADNTLRSLSLIKKIASKDQKGRIIGWYVRINYVWPGQKEKRVNPQPRQSTGVETQGSGSQGINALNTNSINALNINNKYIYSGDSIEYKLSSLLYRHILKRNPEYKAPNWKIWCVDMNKILRIDKRRPEQVEKVINWCQKDDFWQDNILSPRKLRRQYDQLVLKMKKATVKYG
ncbi:MAG: hypothetical protein DRP97_06355 [Candidatus Latescibacterota bacterium]|nr:MAG: hypothetical protein DRP97_06355 [Candidatus Latescibacterota bacterium]